MNKAIFWDFDGTLVYSQALWSKCVLKALQETMQDCQITLDDIRPLAKTGFTWHTPENDYSVYIEDLWWQYMNKQFYKIYCKLGIDETTAHKASLCVRNKILNIESYSLYEDTIYILEKSKSKGYKNYILSNNYPELITTIEKLNLSQYFDDYIISAKVGYDKPRKELFEYALKLANYPDKCFMVGDNPIADIKGAKAVGIKTILVYKEQKFDADYQFDKLSHIENII